MSGPGAITKALKLFPGLTLEDRISPPRYLTLKADETPATADTNVITVSQAGIYKADLVNPSTSATMYVWFGADPSAGQQYVLPPGVPLGDIDIDNKSDMRYKSSVAGGTLIYVLKGRS